MRLLLRLALMVGAVSGLALLGLLAWSTGCLLYTSRCV